MSGGWWFLNRVNEIAKAETSEIIKAINSESSDQKEQLVAPSVYYVGPDLLKRNVAKQSFSCWLEPEGEINTTSIGDRSVFLNRSFILAYQFFPSAAKESDYYKQLSAEIYVVRLFFALMKNLPDSFNLSLASTQYAATQEQSYLVYAKGRTRLVI